MKLAELADQVMADWDTLVSDDYSGSLLTFALLHTTQNTDQAEPQSIFEDALLEMVQEVQSWDWSTEEVRELFSKITTSALTQAEALRQLTK
jgi:hypothetical protein